MTSLQKTQINLKLFVVGRLSGVMRVRQRSVSSMAQAR
jgi:hypothetical protein